VKTALLLGWFALFQAACVTSTTPEQLPLTPAGTAAPEAPSIQAATALPTAGTTQPTIPAVEQPGQERTRPYPTLPPGLERIEVPQVTPITGEAPAGLLDRIMDDLTGRLGIDPQQIEVIRAEAVLWPDGSLGCPKAGEYYTQAIVSGFWIVLEVGTERYDYRASEEGNFFLCERPLPQNLPAPGQ
jgi:hypothetical protein